MFYQRTMDNISIIQDIKVRVDKIQNINISSLVVETKKIERWITWKLPIWPWCKLNTDGARKELGASIAGGLIHNHQGMWLIGLGFNIGVCSVIAAKLWALYQGLNLPWQHGVRFLHVEVDSHYVVQMVNSQTECINEYTPIRSIRDLIKGN